MIYVVQGKLKYHALKYNYLTANIRQEVQLTRKVSQTTKTLLWARTAGRCEMCGKDVTRDPMQKRPLKAGEIAHIKADAPGGPRYDPSQTDDERNSFDNLMLLCLDCHTTIDRNPGEYPADLLYEIKQAYEASVLYNMDCLKPHAVDIITLNAPLGGIKVEISAQECQLALSDSGLAVRNTKPFAISLRDEVESMQGEMRFVINRLCMYKETIRDRANGHAAIFAIAPQPILIGMGLQLGDDDTIHVFQRNRKGTGWSWSDKAEPNSFVFDGTGSSTSDAEDAALMLSISGEINEESIPAILKDPSIPRLRLRAARQDPSSISRKDDWLAFKEQAAIASFKIHESYPNVKRVHVFPAMPTSANIAFGMAWNTRLIPELVVYEKTNGKFYEVIRFGGKNGIY